MVRVNPHKILLLLDVVTSGGIRVPIPENKVIPMTSVSAVVKQYGALEMMDTTDNEKVSINLK